MVILPLTIGSLVHAQDVDSMYVNLYTDSLKPGTYNYINVDGKLKNGRYIPLDTSQIRLSSTDGKFHGNSLWLDNGFKKKKVTISVTLKSDPGQHKTFDVYIKQAPDPELKTEKEVIEEMQKRRKGRRS